MASNRMMRREKKRKDLSVKYKERRNELRKQLNNPDVGLEEKYEILAKFEKMPRDTSCYRLSNRCEITGRARGVERKFSICRHKLRELGMVGEIPGLVKASW